MCVLDLRDEHIASVGSSTSQSIWAIRKMYQEMKLARLSGSPHHALLLLAALCTLLSAGQMKTAVNILLCRQAGQPDDPIAQQLSFIDHDIAPHLRILLIQAVWSSIWVAHISEHCARLASILKELMHALEIDDTELRLLFHLVVLDDTEAYFTCLNLLLGLHSRLSGTELDPLLFFLDLVVASEYKAPVFTRKYLQDDPSSLQFVLESLKVWRGSHERPSADYLQAFLCSLREELTELSAIRQLPYNPASLIKHIDAIVSKRQ